jgi:hypothetical protein
MDQTPDQHYMTREFLEGQIVQFQEIIKSKDEHIQRVTQRDYTTAANLQTIRDKMHEWTMKELEDNGITESQAEEIAEICGFELSKEVEVEVTVTYNMTLQLGYNEEAEDVVNDIDFEAISYDTDKVSWISASIDRIDI